MRHRAALAAMALVLVACDQRMPTEPAQLKPDQSPQLQVGPDHVGVSLSRTSEWVSEFEIIVDGSFQCPDNQTAFISVQVIQTKPNGVVNQGFGSSSEVCGFGTNKWSVRVSGFNNWDKGPAVATVFMSAFTGSDSDQGEIIIK